MITYRGGSGESPADAIEIHGAPNKFIGVKAEYQWLSEKFGERGRDWELGMQALIGAGGFEPPTS